MPITEIHARLSDTATLFIAVIGFWALDLRIRNRPLDSSWFGAAVVAEALLIVQFLLGVYLYLGAGLGAMLPRPFMHILYGVVAILTLPAAYGYFGNLEDEKVKALAMGATALFLWGIILRASQVASYPGPVL